MIRRQLISRWNQVTEVGKSLLYGWIGKRFDHRIIKFSYDRFGRAFRCPQSVPECDVDSGYPRFLDRWNVKALSDRGDRRVSRSPAVMAIKKQISRFA